MASPKTAVANTTPGKGTALVSWKDKMKGYAKEAAAVASETGGGGQFISVRAGQIQYNGAGVAGNKLDVIVVENVLENCYYEGEWDADNPQPPVCFAFGRESDEMSPHEKSAKPQHDTCHGCPNNEFGSAEKGKGKACKNIMRLALLPAKPLTNEAINKSEVAYMKLPVTSVKGFSAYVRRLNTLHELPPFAFITQIGAVPDAKTQFKVTFDDTEMIDDEEILEALVLRHEEQSKEIMFAYSAPTEVEAPPVKKSPRKKF